MKFGSITTGVIADGLVCNFDAANRASYPVQRTLTIAESGSCYNTLDLSQSGNFISDPEFITKPTSASCWAFDGVDDKIYTNASFDNNFTLSAWINCDGTYTAWQPRYALGITPTHSSLPNATIGRLYSVAANLYVGLQLYDTAGANFSTYHVQVKMDGAGWKHCVWTFNNTTKAIYFYLDGVAQTWTHWGGVITSAYLTAPGYSYNNALTIGNTYRVGWTAYYFEGKVGNAQIYNRVLSPSDVLHNYNALKGRFI